MSETDDEWVEPVAILAVVGAVFIGVANLAGSGCTGLLDRFYDGMIHFGDSVAVLSLVGGVVSFGVNRLFASDERRPTERQGPSSSGSVFWKVLGFGGRGDRTAGAPDGEDSSRQPLTVRAMRGFLILFFVGLLATVAGWWLAGTYDIQCVSGFWSGFLSGRIPP
jgi:hypothetical protein